MPAETRRGPSASAAGAAHAGPKVRLPLLVEGRRRVGRPPRCCSSPPRRRAAGVAAGILRASEARLTGSAHATPASRLLSTSRHPRAACSRADRRRRGRGHRRADARCAAVDAAVGAVGSTPTICARELRTFFHGDSRPAVEARRPWRRNRDGLQPAVGGLVRAPPGIRHRCRCWSGCSRQAGRSRGQRPPRRPPGRPSTRARRTPRRARCSAAAPGPRPPRRPPGRRPRRRRRVKLLEDPRRLFLVRKYLGRDVGGC